MNAELDIGLMNINAKNVMIITVLNAQIKEQSVISAEQDMSSIMEYVPPHLAPLEQLKLMENAYHAQSQDALPAIYQLKNVPYVSLN